MKKQGYLVLSLRNINELARLARRSSKQLYRGKVLSKHCVVLDVDILEGEPHLTSSDGKVQLSISDGLYKLKGEVKQAEEVAGIVQRVEATEA